MAKTQFGDARTKLGREHGGKTETHLEANQSILNGEDGCTAGEKTRSDTDCEDERPDLYEGRMTHEAGEDHQNVQDDDR